MNDKEKGEVFDPFGAWNGGLEAFCTPDRVRITDQDGRDSVLSSGGCGREDRKDNEAE